MSALQPWLQEMRGFLLRYFPVFVVVFLAGVLSLAMAVLVLGIGYFSEVTVAEKAGPIFLGVMFASIPLSICKILVTQGNGIAIRLLQVQFVCALAILIPALWFEGPLSLVAVGVTAAVIGIIAVRSHRYAEMIAYFMLLRGRVPESLKHLFPEEAGGAELGEVGKRLR